MNRISFSQLLIVIILGVFLFGDFSTITRNLSQFIKRLNRSHKFFKVAKIKRKKDNEYYLENHKK